MVRQLGLGQGREVVGEVSKGWLQSRDGGGRGDIYGGQGQGRGSLFRNAV